MADLLDRVLRELRERKEQARAAVEETERLEIDDGEQRLLRSGDTVVQNGTQHRWTNRGTEPAVLAVVIVGADRARS